MCSFAKVELFVGCELNFDFVIVLFELKLEDFAIELFKLIKDCASELFEDCVLLLNKKIK